MAPDSGAESSTTTTKKKNEKTKKKNIVVIGGGIIGCTSAYYLTRHPAYDAHSHSITLLEASQIAGGASGKAGGLLALWAYPSSLVGLSYGLHGQLAEEQGGAERWGYRAVHCAQVECVGREVTAVGARGGEKGEGEGGAVTERVGLQKRSEEGFGKLRAAGVPAELDWVHHDSVRGYEEMGDPSTTAQVHPYQFTRSMAALAEEKGAVVHEHARVTSINYTDDGQGVTGVTYSSNDNDGDETKTTIPATDIALAAGPWTSTVYPDAPISALRAHSVTIRPSRPVSAYALFTQIRLPSPFAANARHAGQIVSPEIYARPHNEVYACGEGDHAVALPELSAGVQVDKGRCQDIVDFVASISDELADGEVTARQACSLPNVRGSNSPLVGPTHVRGLWLATGHTCWGIQNGPATGKVVSEFVMEGEAKSAKVKGLDPRNYL